MLRYFCSKSSQPLKLASNYLLRRHSRRRPLSLSSVKKEYPSGPSHPCLSRQTFAITFSITILSIYRHSSKFHSRIILYAAPDLLDGWHSLPGISNLSLFISTFIIRTQKKLQRFKIVIKPDLSDASLHVIDTSEIISDDLMEALKRYQSYDVCEGYQICEDALVFFWNDRMTWGTYTGLTSAPFTNVVTRWDGNVDSLCPTSGRFVYCDNDVFGDAINNKIFVLWPYCF